jgi:hypothetical protein
VQPGGSHHGYEKGMTLSKLTTSEEEVVKAKPS